MPLIAQFADDETAAPAAENDPLAASYGKPVKKVLFVGVTEGRLHPTVEQLAVKTGAPLTRAAIKQSLRQLYATGLFDTLEAAAAPNENAIEVIFQGRPRYFIGRVSVFGAKGGALNAELAHASQLTAGTRFTQARLSRALEEMRATMRRNGFPNAAIAEKLDRHADEQLVDLTFTVTPGAQARIGSVAVAGDPGISAERFQRYAKLKPGKTVDQETANRALAGVLKRYQKDSRFEAEIKLASQEYSPDGKKADFRFTATRGPQVEVHIQGASLSQERLQKLLPIFEEGAVDEDLLNEGNRRLRDYYQNLGYFDVKVEHGEKTGDANLVRIEYKVQLGERRRVGAVAIAGNRYFDSATLTDLLSVHAANPLDRHGAYSQSLVAADVDALQGVYRDNGFEQATATLETKMTPGKRAALNVVYHIDEGEQTRVGAVAIEGNEHIAATELTPLLNTVAGQLLSPRNLTGDRDALLTRYLSRGFDQAQIEVVQTPAPVAANRVNVLFRVQEGQQLFVRKVLLTGLKYTRSQTVERAIQLKPGDPLDQSALAETQRRLYEYGLFSEVNTAIVNPSGGETHKTILIDAAEARRWAITYGFGFEAQTGQPVTNCQGAKLAGVSCSPNGKTGVSPRGLFDITRNNLFGRDQSVALQAAYGLLEQKINLLYQSPHFMGSRNLALAFSAGYANSLDVTTYVASKLEGDFRLTQHFDSANSRLTKANTLIYELDFRRVKVDASSLQVYPDAIVPLSSAQRVAGPQIAWVRDTRDSPLDAHSGSYTTLQEFLSDKLFSSEVNFNRIDVSNANYFGFLKGRLVLARNTRYSQERSFGTSVQQLIPLPERLYGGGPSSHRGFAINAAGPRDPITGYPIGGAGALINSTELRLPPPSLPWFGDALSFVLFEDMGNVFTNAGDAWESVLRIRQPRQESCKADGSTTPTGAETATGRQGPCSFNYFSHTPGIGMRYHTPVGPIRLDFSYNLNPPVYPVNIDYAQPDNFTPYMGRAKHFNFFFSLGQTF